MRWHPELADWRTVGGAGRHLSFDLRGPLGLTPPWHQLWLRVDESTGSRQLNAGEFLRIEGRQELFAIDFDGTIHQFRNGAWSDLGRPE